MVVETRCVTSIYRLELGSGDFARMVSWFFSCVCTQVPPIQLIFLGFMEQLLTSKFMTQKNFSIAKGNDTNLN